MDCLKIADENKDKIVVFFAIGFETTTPMTCALMEQVIKTRYKKYSISYKSYYSSRSYESFSRR